MSPHSLELAIEGHRLQVVPAVHFRTIFAERVNQLCANRATRPNAIVVELGPETCAAAAAWLRKLGVGPGLRQKLPCMLGLTRPNRRVRSSAREAAVSLQRATGKALHELSPRLLHEVLGYSALSVLYLSPTDSIIEAIRCALELDVPLYGVDIDETADAQRKETLIEDPALASDRLEAYVLRNAPYAEAQRDDVLDRRRELVMAVRLRHVLAAHERVLFTGGLAHWPQLERLLHDGSLRPAPVAPARAAAPEGFERVLVHPVLASYHMDMFPSFAQSYQTRRLSPDDPEAFVSMDRHVDVVATFTQMLGAAYHEHFQDDLQTVTQREQLDRRLEDLEARADFEQLLRHLCLLNQTQVPDLFTAVLAAQGTMSPSFSELLTAKLMQFAWATPAQFPGLPLLAPAPTEPGEALRAELLDDDGEGGFRQRGQWVYIHAHPDRTSQRVQVKVPWEWEFSGPPPPPPPPPGVENLSWPPNNYLLGAMSLRAMQIAVYQHQEVRVLPFEGGLGEGLDMKTTLRYQARGDDRVFIRESAPRKTPGGKSDAWDPVVWLLRPGQFVGREWQIIGFGFERLRQHTRAPEQLIQAAARFGVRWPHGQGVMVEAIGFKREFHGGSIPDDMPVPAGLRQCDRVGCTDYDGLLNYTPPFLDACQQAKLAEERDYSRTIFHSSDYGGHDVLPTSMRRIFQEHFNMKLDSDNWPVTMVRMAIPLAREAVTVVAPDAFRLPSFVHNEATRHGVKVRVVPHSYFPKDTLRRLGLVYWVPPANEAGANEFDENYIRILGETPETFRNLIPRRMLEYGTQKSGSPHA